MENLFALAAIVAIVYFFAKFLEMRFILKEVRPLKELIRDTVHVYISVVLGLFIADQFSLVTNAVDKLSGKGANVAAFVDGPGF